MYRNIGIGIGIATAIIIIELMIIRYQAHVLSALPNKPNQVQVASQPAPLLQPDPVNPPKDDPKPIPQEPEPYFPEKVAYCDKVVPILLTTTSQIELERSKILVELLNCDIGKRLPKVQ